MSLYDEADLMEFSEGRVANVLGSHFSVVDSFPRRVRTPGPPFLAVSRVTALEGVPGTFRGARIRTEFDVPQFPWNGVDGQASYLSLDAQGVLFLAAWLGIDFESQGERAYRWVDARLTYLGVLPCGGDCVEYDIRFTGTVRIRGSRLIRVELLASVNGKPVLRTDRCTIGFFSQAHLSAGIGIPASDRSSAEREQGRVESLPLGSIHGPIEREGLVELSRGESGRVLSPARAVEGQNPSLRLSPPVVQFIERVTRISATGGRHGLGWCEAESRADPSHWAVRSHFKDDPVFPGPCMFEGAIQLLQVHALSLGLQAGVRGARFQPVLGRPVAVRFRAQVEPRGQTLVYRAEIVDLGMAPEPFVVADVDIVDNGEVVGCIEGLGVRMASS